MSEQNFSALIQPIQDQISKILQIVERLTVKQDYTDQAINEMKTSINEIKEKPSRRWDKVVETVIVGIVGIFIGFITSTYIN